MVQSAELGVVGTCSPAIGMSIGRDGAPDPAVATGAAPVPAVGGVRGRTDCAPAVTTGPVPPAADGGDDPAVLGAVTDGVGAGLPANGGPAGLSPLQPRAAEARNDNDNDAAAPRANDFRVRAMVTTGLLSTGKLSMCVTQLQGVRMPEAHEPA